MCGRNGPRYICRSRNSLLIKKKIFCFDGDGSITMHLGSLTTSVLQKNLIHIVFNNFSRLGQLVVMITQQSMLNFLNFQKKLDIIKLTCVQIKKIFYNA